MEYCLAEPIRVLLRQGSRPFIIDGAMLFLHLLGTLLEGFGEFEELLNIESTYKTVEDKHGRRDRLEQFIY